MARLLAPKRGELYLTDFDPAIGAEIKKIRPALILQNDIGNVHGPLTIVAAITSFDGDKLYPTEVQVMAKEGGLNKDSVVLLNQLRTVTRERLIKKLGKLDAETMEKIDVALKISLGLVH